MNPTITLESSPQEFIISRALAASQKTVWRALTESKQLEQWFSLPGFSSRAVKHELRPGGAYLYCMIAPDRPEIWARMTYLEITGPDRLVFIYSFSSSEGDITRNPMSETWPLEILSIFTLTEKNDQTTLTLNWTPYNASLAEIDTFKTAHDGMKQGWTGTLDQLASHLTQP